MQFLVPLVLFAFLLALISYVGYRYYARPARYFQQVGLASSSTLGFEEGDSARREGIAIRVIRQIGEKVPISPQDLTMTRRYLVAAGYRSDNAWAVYYGMRVISLVVFLIAGFFLREYVSQSILRIVVLLGAGAAGFFLPSLLLDRLVSRRQERLKFALPDALDLLVVCVEAGLGLDQAIVKVREELEITHPDISKEFELISLEIQAGKRRMEALKNLAARTGEPGIRKLVAILVQTDRFGTSMADSLRTHSDYMRVKRRQEAEERANKVGVKLVFPIFFCILPSMFLVVGGPGLLQVVKYLFPIMKQFGQTQ